MKRILSATDLRARWAKLVQVGFWFFLIKGLLWLIVPLVAAWLGYRNNLF